MYESSMSAFALISLARDAADIAPAIADEYYLLWLNALEGMLYTGVVRSIGQAVCAPLYENDAISVDLSQISVPSSEGLPRACDVQSVFSDGRELVRADAGAAVRYPEKAVFYEEGGRLRLKCGAGVCGTVRVLFLRRPVRKTTENMHTAHVALPEEFLPMALDYLVGHAYALACEDTQAANRLASYNAALSDFEAWQKATGAQIGGEA